VLTRNCIEQTFHTGQTKPTWFFLDDYARWLGHCEGKVADLLAVIPNLDGSNWVLDVIVAESKFVSQMDWRNSLGKARKQLANTVETFQNHFVATTRPLERDIWLHRLADLMFERADSRDDCFGHPVKQWINAVREGRIPVRIRGGIYIFVYDRDIPIDGLDDDNDDMPVGQIILGFNRHETAQMLRFLGDIETATLDCGQRWSSSDAQSGLTQKETESSDTDTRTGLSEILTEESSTPDKKGGPFSEIAPVSKDTRTTDMHAGHKGSFPAPVQEVIAKRASSVEDPESMAWLNEMTARLRKALRSYDLDAKVIGIRLTPNAGLIRLEGSDRLTVDKVKKRQVELKTSHSIDVIHVMAGLGEVVIMVKRPKRIILPMGGLWARRDLPDTSPESNLSLLLGEREDNGSLLYLNLLGEFAGQPEHAPHCLIGGESGSGKGVMIQNMLLELCATNSPENLRIFMIDPKSGVDYFWLQDMPHLNGGIITDQETAVRTLAELVSEMDRRYEVFREVRAKKLSQYNQKVPPDQSMPFICLFHDEMTDWMLMKEYRDAVTESVSKLGVKSRAAGIHLFLIAQRPDKDAIPVQLRANLGNRLALKVADERNSKIILDEAGGEDLLGRGHLAAKLTGQGAPILAQVPFMGEDHSEHLAEVIQAYWTNRLYKKSSIN